MNPALGALFALAVSCQVPGDAVKVTGSFDYKSYIVPKYFRTSPTIALVCVSKSLVGNVAAYVPKSGQILGHLTTPVVPAPLQYTVSLPVKPTGESIDLDFDEQTDKGVQVYAAYLATNLFGDSYLEQIEQASGFSSFLTDPLTGSIRKGTFLVYAPDDQQQVPVGAGKDGLFFTKDDIVQTIPKGFCALQLFEDGGIVVQYDKLTMDILEPAGVETPDFSKQGLLESFDLLLAHLKERYAYTERRGINWDEFVARFRPRAAAADAAKDKEDFYDVLNDLAHAVQDGHVQVVAPYTVRGKLFARLSQVWSGDLGAAVAKLSDGRFVVTAVAERTPAKEAGLAVGSEIVEIDGKPVIDRIRATPQMFSHGTRARIEAEALPHLLSFPIGNKVELTLRQPGGSQTTKLILVARECKPPSMPGFPETYGQHFSTTFLDEGKVGYAQWRDFGDVALNIASWERFLGMMVDRPSMIIDLRGNLGGLQTLYLAMVSYLFAEDKPAPFPWLDNLEFDDKSRSFRRTAKEPARGLWSPRSDLTFRGRVVVLVDGLTASAAEFFAKYLQVAGRGTVIAEGGSDGAGGSLREVIMPEKMIFAYTGGRMLSLGSDEPVLEGKGVVPDVLVPVTLEAEQRKLKGEDVVLSFAVDWLKRGR